MDANNVLNNFRLHLFDQYYKHRAFPLRLRINNTFTNSRKVVLY